MFIQHDRSIIILAVFLIATTICTHPSSAATIGAVRFASGFNRPVFMTSPSGDSNRLFVIEQHSGRINIVNRFTGTANPTPFLTIPGVSTGGEQGLLGLAFHPNYNSNGKFYVNYTTPNQTRIVEYTVSPNNPNVANTTPSRTIMTYNQPFTNHNGGWIGFGPNDGYLYIASGDGGSANDPGNRAQDITDQKLGKILRIDINGDDFTGNDDPNNNRNYAIPANNPFVGGIGDNEIWAYGLRNPWRPSFDRITGDFYLADVGQDNREEVNFQTADSNGGENYGWRLREGFIATPTGGVGGPLPPDATDPIHDYSHEFDENGGFSITGGYVYRGPIAELQGKYFFADHVTEQIWSIEHDGENVTSLTNWTEIFNGDSTSINSIASFAEDDLGNLYILDLGGEIFAIREVPIPASIYLMIVGMVSLLSGARSNKSTNVNNKRGQ